MIVIGVTGNFGTGKSTVSAELKKLGCVIIDADTVAHEQFKPKSPAYSKVIKEFGKGICQGQNIDRRKLGEIVFQNKAQLKRLTNIVHPYIRKAIQKQLAGLKKRRPNVHVVVDAALVFESGWSQWMDVVIAVKANKDLQYQRIYKRMGLTKAEVDRRLKFQMDIRSKCKKADFIVDNRFSLAHTRRQVKDIYIEITKQKH